MNIVFDGNRDEPEVQISGTVAEFRQIAKKIGEVTSRVTFASDGRTDRYYREILLSMICECIDDPELRGRIRVNVEGTSLFVRGETDGLRKLGDGLLNSFNDRSRCGDHLHLYRDEDPLMAPTGCELIFYVVDAGVGSDVRE